VKEKVLIALGGNALLRKGEKGTVEDQLKHVHDTADKFLELIKEGYKISITHGNGPQVGDILLKNEMAKDTLPSMPLDVCGAQSQGFIGYMIQRVLINKLSEANKHIPVVTVLTQVLVNKDDPDFQSPSKPIGPFYSKEEAETLKKEKGWSIVEQIGKGFRRVVPSPDPIDIIEGYVIKKLFKKKVLVISCGGGGIPVIKDSKGDLIGVEAVIDKDHTAAVLAHIIGANILMILTDVEKVFLNFGKEDQKGLDKLSIKEAKEYLKEGEFAKGSMGPKVHAACNFIKNGGKKAIITSLEKCKEALLGKTGTHIG
jgi:carbamate kinase